MGNVVLKCDNLHKNFGKKQILKNVTFDLYEGDILAFIGPNGSGKTTTIKLILGLQSITLGSVLINGFDIRNDFSNAIKRVGSIVENPDFYMYLSGRENLKLIANLYDDVSKERIDEVIKLVGLEKRINDKVAKYSLGMRQRLGVAQAILNKPNLLILDEPTNGLDPEGIKDLRELLKNLAKKEKMAIFVSSHNLSELESFCNKVCIIKNGKAVETTYLNELKQGSDDSNKNYIITLNNVDGIEKKINNISIIDDKNISVSLMVNELNDLLKLLIDKKYEIHEVKIVESSLEDVYLDKTGGNVID